MGSTAWGVSKIHSVGFLTSPISRGNKRLNLQIATTLRLPKGSWAFWGRVWALGAKVWDLTTRVQEPSSKIYRPKKFKGWILEN